MYQEPCKAGFFCAEATSKSNEYLLPCPDYAYCPPATYNYESFYNDASSTDKYASTDFPTTMCPDGTGNDNISGKTKLTDCTPLNEYAGINYLIVINPVNESLIFADNYETVLNDRKVVDYFVFKLSPRELALVTLDLRHIGDADNNFVYDQDWAISFTISIDSNLTVINPEPMPITFLNNNIDRNSVLEFTVMA